MYTGISVVPCIKELHKVPILHFHFHLLANFEVYQYVKLAGAAAHVKAK